MQGKILSLNHIEIAHQLLSMEAAGIMRSQMILQLPEDLKQKVEECLDSYIDSESEDSEDDTLEYGRYLKEIKKMNPRETIGMLKYQKTQIQQIETKHNVKLVLSSTGIKIFSRQQSNLHEAEIDFFENISSKIRSYQIQKYGKQLFLSERVSKKLNQIKVINYQHDKYCFYFHMGEIDEDIAEARILQVQNQYCREYVGFLGVHPRGVSVRAAFKKIVEMMIRKEIEKKSDKNTEISSRGDGFIIQQKDGYSLNTVKGNYLSEIKERSLMFVCLLKNVPDIKGRLTKLEKVEKYLLVAFTDQYQSNGTERLNLIPMMINVSNMADILGYEKFRKSFGNFLKQLYEINEESSFQMGLYFPHENQYRNQLTKKFEAELEKEYKILTPSHRMEGVTLVIPKITGQDAGNAYLKILGAAVKRKQELERLKLIEQNQYKNDFVNEGNISLNQSTLNNTTMIHDQSVYNGNNTMILNNLSLNNTVMKDISPDPVIYYSLNLNLEQPKYQDLENLFKRGQKSNDVEQLIVLHTGELYKVWRISVRKEDRSPMDGHQVSCILKLADYSKDSTRYFHKIKSGKRIDKGLLVQLVVDFSVVEEKEDAFKVKEGRKAQFIPCYEIQLI